MRHEIGTHFLLDIFPQLHLIRQLLVFDLLPLNLVLLLLNGLLQGVLLVLQFIFVVLKALHFLLQLRNCFLLLQLHFLKLLLMLLFDLLVVLFVGCQLPLQEDGLHRVLLESVLKYLLVSHLFGLDDLQF